MSSRYPKFKYFLFDSEKLQRRIRGEYSALSSYQLFFLFRANLAAALAKRKLSYWMTQQDTLWRSNLADFNLENRYSNADIIVDRIGNEQMSLYQKRDQWINGATYFVRGGWRSAGFFELLSTKLKRWCAPDSAIMTYLCMTAQPNGVVCNWIPHSIMSSSDWLFTDRSHPPHFLQIDHLRSDEKMEVFRQSGLNFLGGNNIAVCNRTAVEHAKILLQNGTLFPDRYFDFSSRMSEFFLDLLLILIPGGTEFYRKYMFLLVYGDRL
uniref:Nucleotide-diphospho-sugar transferase domain-containing protein n=1 Tax=Plectus sambesii TaxID=2011161 RepID=A0A914UT24_9BILA